MKSKSLADSPPEQSPGCFSVSFAMLVAFCIFSMEDLAKLELHGVRTFEDGNPKNLDKPQYFPFSISVLDSIKTFRLDSGVLYESSFGMDVSGNYIGPTP